MTQFLSLCILAGDPKGSKRVHRRPFFMMPKSHTLIESIRLNPATSVFKSYPEFRNLSGDDRLIRVITHIMNFVNSPLNVDQRYKFVIIDIKTRERTNEMLPVMYKDFIPYLIFLVAKKRTILLILQYTKLLYKL